MTKKYVSIVSLFLLEMNAVQLFEQFQELKDVVPHVQLANLPTPLQRSDELQKILGCDAIFIKRDDCTCFDGLYGGNKVRKLEFLLGDAIQKKAQTIITYGCIGTNHGLATACYSKQLGLSCLLMLKHQPNSSVVRQNLLLDHYFGAQMKIFNSNEERAAALENIIKNMDDVYFFPTGGSVPSGALGYVNAALELKEQIKAGEMPEPDVIYIPIGSAGTVAGLLVGCKLAGIASKIIAVAIEPEEFFDEFYYKTKTLFFETNSLLHEYSSGIPLFDFPEDQLVITKDFCGTEYGLWIDAGNEAAQIMFQAERITLEGTYSAKGFAALIADNNNGIIKKDAAVLFWNTYCGLDFSAFTSQIDYEGLPREVHWYFENI